MTVVVERRHTLAALFGFAVAVAVTSVVAGIVTEPEIPRWYHALARPSWTPPDGLFSPVWTTIYVLMALVGWAIWRQTDSPARSLALRLWWAQLAANFAWSPLFFGLHLMGLAFLDIIVLAGLIAATIAVSVRIIPLAGWMLFPYLLWVLYAAALNGAIWRMNG